MHVSVQASIRRNCDWLIKPIIVYLMVASYMDSRGNSRAKTCTQTRLRGRVVFISYERTQALPGLVVIHNNRTDRMASAGDVSFKFLAYQLPTVGYWPTVAMRGNGELGSDFGEGS